MFLTKNLGSSNAGQHTGHFLINLVERESFTVVLNVLKMSVQYAASEQSEGTILCTIRNKGLRWLKSWEIIASYFYFIFNKS